MSDQPHSPDSSRAESRAPSPAHGTPQADADTEKSTAEMKTPDHDHTDKPTSKSPSREKEEHIPTELHDTTQASNDSESAPPLPDEVPPPLPDEAPPGKVEDDGWEPVWDANAQAFYFFNRFTGLTQWENPRVPEAAAPGTVSASTLEALNSTEKKAPVLGGYNPAIHGDYDPNASYAQQHEEPSGEAGGSALDPAAAYAATGTFNRFTGRWQADSIRPENYNDENKSRRQMNAFFDVDAAANSHDGRSLKAERSGKKLSKKELKMFKEKRRERKEEKRRAWLRD
ncbi:hypothetical protein POX_a00164 [Penicillium oxalicum]|uniref:WW domain-containing protein n=1 Tax=Penicillium oxalicum (strain 114-2 / CGMCC 5302) TaxID=933388 RepID=S7ZVY4_PENO1|nr:hypothetical protein POX_a00164 [Penicillium oxalicum]EPS34870.1 hypothetical protein PDE_09834 [Penicillium oxalicum 114-2]KAI2793583.1 hypothetical protein POX_a00164 [Penicillium oxalicum]